MGFFGSISKLFEKVPPEDGEVLSPSPSGSEDTPYADSSFYIDNGDGTVTEKVSPEDGEVLSPSSSGSEDVTYADSSFYVDNGDGTVTDKRTGLMWMRCAAGQKFEKGIVSGVAGTFTWNHAIGLRLGFAGFNDWELPDIESLKSIVDLNRTNPAILPEFFPSTPCSSFWSRTTSEFPGAAWMVHFGRGFSDSVSALKMCHVRFVRKLLPETLKRSLSNALVECNVPRGDLVNFVHKNRGLINAGLFDNGRTMLHLAAQAGKLQIVEWLLQKGAEANAIDCRGDTPFDLATAAGATRTADYLKSRLPSQETTIQVAISPENNLEIQHGPSTAPAVAVPEITCSNEIASTDSAKCVTGDLVKLEIRTETVPLESGENITPHVPENTTATPTSYPFLISNDDGTVTDTRTGLMWMRAAEGRLFTWSAANAQRRYFSGHADWRLPTIEELRTIVEKGKTPAINTDTFLFTLTPDISLPQFVFWSSEEGRAMDFAHDKVLENQIFELGVRFVRNTTLLNDVAPTTGHTATIATNIEFATATTWLGSGFDYLLRDIEDTDKPSASLMKALANQSLLVSRVGGAKNRTLLHHAAAHGKLATVKYLWLKCRANLNATDQDGDTPLDYALASNAVEVAEYLRSKEARTRTDLSASVPNHLQLSKTVSETRMEETETARPTDLVQSSTPAPVFGGDVFRAETIDVVKNATAELTQRIEQLEASLREVLLKLETLEAHQVSLPKSDGIEGDGDTVASAFSKVLAWLATLERVSQADLRRHLLPLDLLPSAVIDEINERALDLMGEIALEESGEEILVFREVLATVIANHKYLP